MDDMPGDPGRLEAAFVPPDIYDEEYYLTKCAGFDDFHKTGGQSKESIYQTAIEWSGLQPGMVVCDVGAGRGELVAQAARFGARVAIGIEYSAAAANLSAKLLADGGLTDRARVTLADARQ